MAPCSWLIETVFFIESKIMNKLSICLITFFIGINQAYADDVVVSKLTKQLNAEIPGVGKGATISSVTKTPYSGLYEVVINGQVVYTDDKAKYLFLGNVIDLATLKNLTQARVDRLGSANPTNFPLDHAIKFVKGDGSRKLYIFSDPECPYCKRLEQDLAQVTNITYYVFPFPLDSLHPGSTALSKTIWCAKDRKQAWLDALLSNKASKNDGNCENPVAADMALGESLHITGTPTMFFANGQRIAGALPADKIEQLLNAVK